MLASVRILVACDLLHGYYVVKTVTALSLRENITLDFDSIAEVGGIARWALGI